MPEMWVGVLAWEDPMEEENFMDGGAWQATVLGVTKRTEGLSTQAPQEGSFHFHRQNTRIKNGQLTAGASDLRQHKGLQASSHLCPYSFTDQS